MKKLIPFSPRNYQARAISDGWARRKIAFLMSPGAGKTACATMIMAKSIHEFDIANWLVIAPKMVCQTSWVSEFEKWMHTRSLTVTNLVGLPPKDRAEKVRQSINYNVTVINYDNLVWLVKQWGQNWPYDGVVLDESSKCKDPSTKRFKALKWVSPFIDRLIEMTGSPAAQGMEGLWPQMYLLDQGDALGRTVTMFRQTFFDEDAYSHTRTLKPGAKEKIEQDIRHLCTTIDVSDYENIDQPLQYDLPCTLPDEARKLYDDMERDMAIELSGQDVVAANAGVLVSKLQQVANGAMYLPEEDAMIAGKSYEILHDAKLAVIDNFLEEMNGQPFLLAYYFKSDKERLLSAFEKRGFELFDGTPEQIKRFGRGEISMLGIHPQSGGHGVDGLQYGTNTVVWMSPPWSLEQYEQLNGRVTGTRQIGTEFEGRPGNIYHVITTNTVDETADQVLRERAATQRSFIDALKGTLGVE